MFVQVRLLKGFQEPLLYEVPVCLRNTNLIGAIVKVPIKNRFTAALVEKIVTEKPSTHFVIKPVHSCEPFPEDKSYTAFITKLASYYQLEPITLVKRVRRFLQQNIEHELVVPHNNSVKEVKNTILTEEQLSVTTFLMEQISKPVFAPTLLHGVTGSGKTEVYKRLIKHTIDQKKTVMLLLPEVTLAVQFTNLLRKHFDAEFPMFSFHSASSAKEKKTLWQQLLSGNPCLIIGVHLPILLPVSELGLIIIDEEHEVGYQEKKHPKINSKEAALMRAQSTQIPILLGSATPSLASLYAVQKKGWHFFQLKKRFQGNFPEIELVSLTEKKKKRNSFWISTALEQAIQERLSNKEQTILFLNRRGFSFFMQCKACSFIFRCSHCSVSLTLHENLQLTCHYCGFVMQQPTSCFSCKAPEKELLKKGIGTQQLVAILQKIFPTARIARADMDATVNKKMWQKTMQDFQQGDLDILVGTQTITKGYHFPRVTLVGVLWADLAIHFPMYNATETALQQLIQVAGRAGRESEKSLVIVQTMVEHPIFNYLNELDYLSFYTQELEQRKELSYPPILRLVELELKNSNEQCIEQEATILAHILRKKITDFEIDVQLLGPAKPPVHKIKNWHSRKIYLKSSSMQCMQLLFQLVDKKKFRSTIFFTANPLV